MPQGLSRTDGKRPDGVTMLPFSYGRCMSWDATCWNALAPSHVAIAAKKNGAVAEHAETQKRSKYEGSLENVDFVPLAVESTGAVGPSFLKLLSKLSARITDRGGRDGAHSRLLRERSVAVELGNAACILEIHERPEQQPILPFDLASRLSLPSLSAYGLMSGPRAQ